MVVSPIHLFPPCILQPVSFSAASSISLYIFQSFLSHTSSLLSFLFGHFPILGRPLLSFHTPHTHTHTSLVPACLHSFVSMIRCTKLFSAEVGSSLRRDRAHNIGFVGTNACLWGTNWSPPGDLCHWPIALTLYVAMSVSVLALSLSVLALSSLCLFLSLSVLPVSRSVTHSVSPSVTRSVTNSSLLSVSLFVSLSLFLSLPVSVSLT